MRGGIPITARLFALASLFSGKSNAVNAPEVIKANKQYHGLRNQQMNGAGTEQRKRRQAKRRINKGRRR